jgi:hypothetical protein
MQCRLQLAGEAKPIAFTSVKSVNTAAAKVPQQHARFDDFITRRNTDRLL